MNEYKLIPQIVYNGISYKNEDFVRYFESKNEKTAFSAAQKIKKEENLKGYVLWENDKNVVANIYDKIE